MKINQVFSRFASGLATTFVCLAMLLSMVAPLHAQTDIGATSRASLLAIIENLKRQVEALEAQLRGGGFNQSGGDCVILTKSMYLGSQDNATGGEVTKLQLFLTQTGDFTYGKTTGYFGPATQTALQRWQARKGIVSSGDPETTGFGVVGGKTREVMAKCSGVERDATVEILFPQGGEVIDIGTVVSLEFTVEGIKKASIALYQDDKWVSWIAKDVDVSSSGKRSYKWKVPTTIEKNLNGLDNLSIYVTGTPKSGIGYKDDKSSEFSLKRTAQEDYFYTKTLGYQFEEDTPYDPNLSGLVHVGDEKYVNVWFEWADDINKFGSRVSGAGYSDKVKVTSDKKITQVATTKGVFVEGKKYYYRMNGTSPDGVMWTGNTKFFVVPSYKSGNTITIISPNGGEEWVAGEMNTITWAPYSYDPDINPAKDVKAYLYKKDSRGNFVQVGQIMPNGKASIHTSLEIDSYGNYPASGKYYVKIVNNVTGAAGMSERPFTIINTREDIVLNVLPVEGNRGYTDSNFVTDVVATCYLPENDGSCEFIGHYGKDQDKVKWTFETGNDSNWVGVSFRTVGPFPHLGLEYVEVIGRLSGGGSQLTAIKNVNVINLSSELGELEIKVNGEEYAWDPTNPDGSTNVKYPLTSEIEAYARCAQMQESNDIHNQGLVECYWKDELFYRNDSWKG